MRVFVKIIEIIKYITKELDIIVIDMFLLQVKNIIILIKHDIIKIIINIII